MMTGAENSQAAVLVFLADPATHGGQKVKRIDTHAASVFLAGERAFKIKRAVRFPFLDYSTLDRRKAACTAELEVNRPYAPQIYRRVVAITRAADGALDIGGAGEPVEWAVEMHRFDEGQTLDHVAAAGKIDVALADTLGRVVALAHGAAPPVEPAGWIVAVGAYADEHAAAFRRRPDLFPTADVRALAEASHAAYRRIRTLLAERGRRSLVRRLHGDLHLGNIALIDGRPVLFDAIEFSDLIASGDVLYDLAFLLMDLIERGLAPLANVVLNRYLAATRGPDDFDGLAALPFFLSLRAAIRAEVTAARLAQSPAREQPILAQTARGYFRLALRLIAPPPPMLLAIGGLSGTGKSVLARALAPELSPAPGAVLLRSDAERKARFGLAETERLPPAAYAPQVTAEVYAALAAQAGRIVAAGHSAIVDAVFADAAERADLAAVAQASGVSFRSLFLTADLAVRLTRVGRRAVDASDANAAIVRRQENYDLGRIDWQRVDASGPAAETLRRAKAALGLA